MTPELLKRTALEKIATSCQDRLAILKELEAAFPEYFASRQGQTSRPSSILTYLKRYGFVVLNGDTYSITEKGRETLRSPEGVPTPGNLVKKMDGEYLCPELGRTCDRPGAYDFTKIPSRMGNRRVECKSR